MPRAVMSIGELIGRYAKESHVYCVYIKMYSLDERVALKSGDIIRAIPFLYSDVHDDVIMHGVGVVECKSMDEVNEVYRSVNQYGPICRVYMLVYDCNGEMVEMEE